MRPFEKVARTPEHQFIGHLIDKFGILPDDPFYENINPYLKVWLYERWLHSKELELEQLRSFAILVGSFFNPEMAYKMSKSENPDFKSTDFDAATKAVREQILDASRDKKKRKKRKVVD